MALKSDSPIIIPIEYYPMSEDGRFEGYILDTTYADRFYKELSPVWLNYVLTINGIQPFALRESFNYLEIGCGNAHSCIVNAASYPHSKFYACDVNKDQIHHARRLAEELSLENIEFHASPIESLVEQNLLPELDFVVLHGVYSWVNANTREAIKNAIDLKLRSGGVVYLSYNCQPGNVYEAPLRKMMIELAKTKQGNSGVRAAQALAQIKELSGAFDYFKTNPAVMAAVEARLKESGQSLAHEFMNETWESFYSVDLADEMEDIGLNYAGSATLVDNHPPLAQSAKATEVIQKLPSTKLQRLSEDFASNRAFRRDIFVKGRARADAKMASSNLGDLVLGHNKDLTKLSSKARIPRGLLTFDEGFIGDLRSLMEKGSFSIGEIIYHLGKNNPNHTEILRNLLFLTAAGVLTPFACVSKEGEADQEKLSETFLKSVLKQIVSSDQPRAIPSNVAGNGFLLTPFEACGILLWLETPKDTKNFVKNLESKARTLVSLQTRPPESLKQSCAQFKDQIQTTYMPWLKNLGYDVCI